MSRKIAIDEREVLIVVDIQNDFCPGGSLSPRHGGGLWIPIHRIPRIPPPRPEERRLRSAPFLHVASHERATQLPGTLPSRRPRPMQASSQTE